MIWLVTVAIFCLTASPENNGALCQTTACPAVCKEVPLEISLVIDVSSSIWRENFTLGLWFVQNFVDKFDIGPNKVRVSAVSYGDRVYTEDAFNFDKYSDKESLNKAITNIPYKGGSTTETGAAIRHLLDNQLPLARPGVRKVIIVLTDGNSQRPEITKAEADRARNANLEVFAIGVGLNISTQELENIAKDKRHVFIVGAYNLLNDIMRRLEHEVCGKTPEPVCKYDPVDIAFVIDSSVSVGQENFTLGLEFIKEFIQTFEINPSAIRVAAVMYGERVYNESAIPFDAYKKEQDTVNAILKLKWEHGGRTETGMGINYMVQNFLPNTRPHATHIGIVITDGESQNPETTKQEAEIARNKGIVMFAVGVGKLSNGGTIDDTELINIAGDRNRVLTASDYARLNVIKEDLIRTTCVGIQESIYGKWLANSQP